MKRFFLFLAIIIPIMMQAGIVTEQDALFKAKQFMPDKSFQLNEKANQVQIRGQIIDVPAYYVFNADNNDGFVIVSADDRTEAILGYADNGSFDTTNMPSNVEAWLQFYEQTIRSLNDGQTMATPERPSHAAITPLIKTKWGQGAPYNSQCPLDEDERSLTGCVATALAQIMYYYKWPKSPTDVIPSYTTSTKGIYLDELPVTSFRWDLMKDQYEYKATGDSADAVAELMRYCGQLNNMNYTKSASGAHIHEDRLVELFDYSNNMHTIKRSAYTNRQWEEIIYNELVNESPVLYSGSSLSGGHQFICDGYDGNGLFHINWGWGGNYDGFFVLSFANPYGEGVGGSIGSKGFSYYQDAIIGCKPSTTGESIIPNIESYEVSVSTTNYYRSSSNLDFEGVSISGKIDPYYSVLPDNAPSIEIGWALYQNGIFKECIGYQSGTIRFADYGTYLINNSMTVSFGANLENGKYQLCQVYRFSEQAGWNLCYNSTINSLIIDISDTEMTIRKIDSANLSYSINEISFSEIPCINKPLYITLNLTNDGEATYQKIYFWIRQSESDNWTKEIYAITYLDYEETGSLTMLYTPSTAGLIEYKITSDEKGLETKNTGSINISDVESVTIEGVVYSCIINSRKATIINADDNSLPTNLIIPASITYNEVDYAVTGIGVKAFFNKNNIVSVIISEGVKTIGEGAFRHCYGLKKTDLPSTIESIGEYAFGNCSRLSYVTVRNGNPFAINENVYGISIWDEENGSYINNPTSATLCVPIGTTTLFQATAGWNKFSTILEGEIKETTIDGMTFTYATCSKIATLTEGKTTTSELTIPASININGTDYAVTGIGANAFYNKNNLVSVIIPEGVKTIGESAFESCFYLKKLDLPSTIESIDEYAFGNCSRLSYVTVRNGNPFAINENVYGISIWDEENGSYINNPTSATLCVPIGTTTLFQATAGWNKFSTILEGEIKEATIDGMTYEYVTGPRTATLTKGETTASELTILSSINIDGVDYTVTGIGENAFNGTPGIKNLTISEGIINIGRRAFQSCYNLKKIYLPSTLSIIDEFAFSGCNKLTYVTVRNENPCAISDNTFDKTIWDGNEGRYIHYPTSAKLCVPIGTTALYQSTDGWNMFSTILEGEIKEAIIDGMTFIYVTGSKVATLTEGKTITSELAIPASINIDGIDYSVIEIGEHAFYNNINLVSVIIPEGIKAIGEGAFRYCYYLEKLDLPLTIESIDEYAFCNCNLTCITVRNENPVVIKDNVFDKTTSATLCVPKGTAGKYQETVGWSRFVNIEEPLVITALDYTIQYGDNLPEFNYVCEGIKLSGTPQISCVATNQSPIGTYPIIIRKGSVTNHNDSYIDGTLTITKASLTITANDYFIWQNDTMPELNVLYQGFKNNEDSTVLNRFPIVTPETTETNATGEYSLNVSGAEAQNYDITYFPGKLVIKERINGDVTGSGVVTIQDATIVVNYILGERSDNYAYYMADMNNDTEIDVFDLTAIINVILGRNSFQSPMRTRGSVYESDTYLSSNSSFSIVRNENISLRTISDKICLSIANASRFTSFQMDIEVPDGAELHNVELMGSKNAHFVQKSKISDNLYRVIALSMSCQPLADDSDELVNFQITSTLNEEIKVNNVMFVTPKGKAHYFKGSSSMTPTILNEIITDKDDVIIDLSGRRIYKKPNELERGVYLINNEKVIIK